MQQQYAFIIPTPGAAHAPNNGHPWQFEYGGAWYPLVDEKGKPKPYPIDMARVAERFFTPSDQRGDLEPLVSLDVREGTLEFAEQAPQTYTDPETGEEYETLPELLEAVKARARSEAQAENLDDPAELSELTFPALRKLAEERGVPCPAGTTKEQLVTALAEAAAA